MKIKSEPISPIRVAYSMMAVAVVFALTVVMLLIGPKMLGEGVIALLYLVPCGWCTVRWGRIAGVSAALTAALCFDFLFIPPYGTFNIGSLEGWLLLFLFIAGSILVVGRFQAILRDEQNRERKATFLYEIVASIANQQTRGGIARVIANQIQQKYLAELVQVYLYSRGNKPVVVMCAGNEPDCVAKPKPDRVLPIVSGPALIGEIAIWKGLMPLPSEDDRMVQTILRQTAAALDRAQLVEENISPTGRSQQENSNVSPLIQD
jgi:K+-sensing histidine kinase KdpD